MESVLTLDTELAIQPPSYYAEVGYSAAKFSENVWESLLKNDLEGYRMHLAFDSANVAGFKTGYIALKRHQVVVCLAPFFITDYALDSSVPGKLKTLLQNVRERLPFLLKLKVLCIGSPVTDSCKMAVHPDYPLDPAMLTALDEALHEIARKSDAAVIAFKDLVSSDFKKYENSIRKLGYSAIKNIPLAHSDVHFDDIESYLSSLSQATRQDLQQKLKENSAIEIQEVQGLPDNLEEIYALYLQTYQRSELKFEKLTPSFFEFVAGLMPEKTRFVLYYRNQELIAFNMCLHNQQVLMDKYIGIKEGVDHAQDILLLSWIHNIEICIREGIPHLQSGQTHHETKKWLGATFEDTYMVFKHTNRLLNTPLNYLAKLLAHENAD